MVSKVKNIKVIFNIALLIGFIFNIVCMLITNIKLHFHDMELAIHYAWAVMMGDYMWRIVSLLLIIFASSLLAILIIARKQESRELLYGPFLLLILFLLFIYATSYKEILLSVNIYLISIYILIGIIFMNLIFYIVLLIQTMISQKSEEK